MADDLPPSGPPAPVGKKGNAAAPASKSKFPELVKEEEGYDSKKKIMTFIKYSKKKENGVPVLNNFLELHNVIGKGAYGKVRLAREIPTARWLALKEMSKMGLKKMREYLTIDGKPSVLTALDKVQVEISILKGPSGNQHPQRSKWKSASSKVQVEISILKGKQVQVEISILKGLQHPNVLRLLAVFDDENQDTMYLVFECANLGAILRWESDKLEYECRIVPGTVRMKEDMARSIFVDCLHALLYLKKNRIVHRDVKPDNILMRRDGSAVLGDFGEAKILGPDPEAHMLVDNKGTFHFFSPEACSGDKYDGYASDLWALGICLYAMTYGTVPWVTEDGNNYQLFNLIRETPLKFPDTNINPELKDLLVKMLEKDETKRLKDVEKVLEHKWVKANNSKYKESFAKMMSEASLDSLAGAVKALAIADSDGEEDSDYDSDFDED
eukprot:g52448.t1